MKEIGNIEYYFDIIQGTDEWHKIRMGKIGGSESEPLSVKGKSDNGLGVSVYKLMHKKIFEIVKKESPDSSFISEAMYRGMDLEPFARNEYEINSFKKVDECGYIYNSNYKYAGYSPDGLVGNDGIIEIKCPLHTEYIRSICEKTIPKNYYAQMQWGLLLSNRKYCDYVVYNPDFDLKKIQVQRVDRDEELINTMIFNYKTFEVEIETRLTNLNYEFTK